MGSLSGWRERGVGGGVDGDEGECQRKTTSLTFVNWVVSGEGERRRRRG